MFISVDQRKMMNFTLGGVFKIASACIVVASVATVLATEDLSFMFDFKREERYPPLPRRRRKKIQWPTWKSICFWRRNGRKNQRKVTYDEEIEGEIVQEIGDLGVLIALTDSHERNCSYPIMDKSEFISYFEFIFKLYSEIQLGIEFY